MPAGVVCSYIRSEKAVAFTLRFPFRHFKRNPQRLFISLPIKTAAHIYAAVRKDIVLVTALDRNAVFSACFGKCTCYGDLFIHCYSTYLGSISLYFFVNVYKADDTGFCKACKL